MEEFTAVVELTNGKILKIVRSGKTDSEIINELKGVFGKTIKSIDIYKMQKISRIEFQYNDWVL